MFISRAWRHVVHAFRWSTGERIGAVEALAAAFGMVGPVLIGVLSGQVPAGFIAALGGLAVGGVEAGAAFSAHARRELQALAPVLLAALLAVAAGGHGWLAELLLILTALIAAAIGGFSRLMAVATTRFILFLMIVSAMPAAAFDQRAGFLALIALGALWTSMLGFAFGILARKNALVPQQEPQQRQATWTQKLKRWAQSMRNVDGWNYTIRLGACLLIALAATLLWPGHHLHWISITAALLISRKPEPTSLKTTQRTLGTAVGVVLSALVLRSTLPAAVLVVAVGVLAGARPLLRNGNYLVYSAAMTPLIILIIDAGRVPDSGLLVDRLIATLIGAALVVGTNLLMMRFVSDSKPIS